MSETLVGQGAISHSLEETARRWSADRAARRTADDVPHTPSTTPLKRFIRRFRNQRLAMLAAGFILFLILVTILGGTLYPVDPNTQKLSMALRAPGVDGYPLGSDVYGRDVLSRLISGTHVSLAAGGIAVSVAVLIGTPLGLAAGLLRGWIDRVLLLATDTLMCFPALLLAIAIVTARGPGLVNSMIAVGITQAPRLFRLVRGTVLSVREETYIDVSRSIGTSTSMIAVKHVLPNVLPPLLVQLSVFMAQAMLAEAALSYLGLGVLPPQSSWGSMLSEASRYLSAAPTFILWPGLCIGLTVLALNVLGDGLRDSLGRETQTGR
ncbi:MAG: ABC transporter permease [Rhizobiaceae bacterium]|nr:ABC transporter permease [Rhizobiaceae bacterium]